MRYFAVILMALMVSPVLFAAETSVSLDRCVILNDANNQSAESMAAIYFAIPDSLMGKEIIYSEMEFPFSLQALNDSSLYELKMHAAAGEWSEGSIDYEEAEALTDSLAIGAYMIKLDGQSVFHIDITRFIYDVVNGERTNYGLMAIADHLGDYNIRLPSNIGNVIRNSASVRIVFK